MNILSCRKIFPCAPALNKVGQFIPRINTGAFLAGHCNAALRDDSDWTRL